MKAVVCNGYGDIDVLKIEERQVCEPKKNEILVEVKYAAVTPSDCVFRKGKPFIARFFTGLFRPKNNIPGEIFSGIVKQVGEEVKNFKVGDAIYGSAGMTLGAYAEKLCLTDSNALLIKPDNVLHEQAAASVDGGLTALSFLRDYAKIKSGQSILINGASGAVGSAAIQIAKYFKANVTAVCSNENSDFVKKLGVDSVLDYNKEKYYENTEKFDIIFDAVGKSNFKEAKRCLKMRGVYLSTVPTLKLLIQMLFTKKSKTVRAVFAATGMKKNDEKIKDLQFLRGMLEDKTLVHHIDKIFSLDKIKEAQIYVEAGHKKGNVMLEIRS